MRILQRVIVLMAPCCLVVCLSTSRAGTAHATRMCAEQARTTVAGCFTCARQFTTSYNHHVYVCESPGRCRRWGLGSTRCQTLTVSNGAHFPATCARICVGQPSRSIHQHPPYAANAQACVVASYNCTYSSPVQLQARAAAADDPEIGRREKLDPEIAPTRASHVELELEGLHHCPSCWSICGPDQSAILYVLGACCIALGLLLAQTTSPASSGQVPWLFADASAPFLCPMRVLVLAAATTAAGLP